MDIKNTEQGGTYYDPNNDNEDSDGKLDGVTRKHETYQQTHIEGRHYEYDLNTQEYLQLLKNKLSPIEYQITELFFVEGATYKKVQRKLHMTRRQVQYYWQSAKEKLK